MMTLYLTEGTDAADLVAAARDGLITAVKLYPAGATTNSASGVRDIDKVMPVLEAMAEAGVPLCVHGEVTDSEIDIFDREAVFIDRVLDPLRRRLPALRVVMEHVTTADGIDYVRSGGESIAATLTTHHLFINRNHILAGGIRPHYYCLPVAKRETHRLALVAAATSGDPSFFLGTDSAPHLDTAKLAPCGCAGIYTAPNTLACLAQIFDNEGALDRLDGFVARHGAAFYGVAVNDGTGDAGTHRRAAASAGRPDDIGRLADRI
jgi:dihydroorotase